MACFLMRVNAGFNMMSEDDARVVAKTLSAPESPLADTEASRFLPRFTVKDVTVHRKERAYKGCFAIDRYEMSYKRFDGQRTKVLVREIFERDRNAVVMLPYDALTDEVMFIEQFRPGALSDPLSPWLVEVIAGMIDPGEDPLQAAVRELEEEGHLKLRTQDLIPIGYEYPSPGGVSERVNLYVASADLSHLDKHGGLESESEDLRLFKSSAKEAFRQAESGRLCNAATLLCVQYLQIHHESLRARCLKLRRLKPQ